MKLDLKEDPKEWRKAGLLSALGMMILSTVLHWRHVLPKTGWVVALAVLVVVMLSACFQPRWFRGYYRTSSRVGFFITEQIGRVVLVIFFLLVLTPLGLALRLLGKDPLRLKRPRDTDTHWSPTRESSPLDRLF